MLSEMVDTVTRRSTAGMRIEVPGFLKTQFKVLDEYGRKLRARHKRGTKTHVKFDDAEMVLFLNVKLKDENEWSRVYSENAATWLKQMKREDSENLGRRLNSRTTSLSTGAGAGQGGELEQGARSRSEAGSTSKQRPAATKVTSWSGSAETPMT